MYVGGKEALVIFYITNIELYYNLNYKTYQLKQL